VSDPGTTKSNALSGSRRVLLLALSITSAVLFSAACRTQNNNSNQITVVVKATAAGQVQRLLVSEGVRVNAGTPLIEIAPDTGPAPSSTPSGAPTPNAADIVTNADREVEQAREDVVRNEANVQRLTPLVASGQASQAELDGAQALYQQAQQRLQRAQDTAATARQSLDVSRQPNITAPSASVTPGTRSVIVVAPVSGTVTVIGAKVGDRVIIDQPVATVRSDR
jgi:multidrug resistance efflux pump